MGLTVFGLALAATYVWMLFQPAQTSSASTRYVVKKGATLTTIAGDLEEQGILRSALSLRILSKLGDENAVIQPGTYQFSASMPPREILDGLLSETQDTWVTLLEGWRMEEIARELSGSLRGFDENAFLPLVKQQEGMLFPDTYLFPKDSSEEAVHVLLLSTFEKRYNQALTESPTQPVFPKKETLILASLIEREAKTFTDMKMVAGILKNRLDLGMPLQVDATLQYAKGYDQATKSWWSTPKAADKDLVSPFNTYTNSGLPPSPISNPGLNALKAAMAPQETDNLYYLHDNQGKPYYAKTYEEHQKNIALYLR